MNNTEISNNDPGKELKKDKAISRDNTDKVLIQDTVIPDNKTKQVNKKNTPQNKKITSKNDNSNKSLEQRY